MIRASPRPLASIRRAAEVRLDRIHRHHGDLPRRRPDAVQRLVGEVELRALTRLEEMRRSAHEREAAGATRPVGDIGQHARQIPSL